MGGWQAGMADVRLSPQRLWGCPSAAAGGCPHADASQRSFNHGRLDCQQSCLCPAAASGGRRRNASVSSALRRNLGNIIFSGVLEAPHGIFSGTPLSPALWFFSQPDAAGCAGCGGTRLPARDLHFGGAHGLGQNRRGAGGGGTFGQSFRLQWCGYFSFPAGGKNFFLLQQGTKDAWAW